MGTLSALDPASLAANRALTAASRSVACAGLSDGGSSGGSWLTSCRSEMPGVRQPGSSCPVYAELPGDEALLLTGAPGSAAPLCLLLLRSRVVGTPMCVYRPPVLATAGSRWNPSDSMVDALDLLLDARSDSLDADGRASAGARSSGSPALAETAALTRPAQARAWCCRLLLIRLHRARRAGGKGRKEGRKDVMATPCWRCSDVHARLLAHASGRQEGIRANASTPDPTRVPSIPGGQH